MTINYYEFIQILSTSLVMHNICLNITGHIYQERNKPLQWTVWCSVIFHGSCWCNVYHLQKTRQNNSVLPKGQTRPPCDEITAPDMPVSCWTTPRFELSFHLDVSCTPEFLSQHLAQLCHQQLTKSVHSHLNTCQTPINHLCGTSHASRPNFAVTNTHTQTQTMSCQGWKQVNPFLCLNCSIEPTTQLVLTLCFSVCRCQLTKWIICHCSENASLEHFQMSSPF